MHEEIIRFPLEGETSARNLIEERERLVHFLETSMKDEGVTPCLNMEPQFSIDFYIPENDTYKFTLSCYGVYVGEQAWQTSGVMDGKTIMTTIHPDKSKQSSTAVTLM